MQIDFSGHYAEAETVVRWITAKAATKVQAALIRIIGASQDEILIARTAGDFTAYFITVLEGCTSLCAYGFLRSTGLAHRDDFLLCRSSQVDLPFRECFPLLFFKG